MKQLSNLMRAVATKSPAFSFQTVMFSYAIPLHNVRYMMTLIEKNTKHLATWSIFYPKLENKAKTWYLYFLPFCTLFSIGYNCCISPEMGDNKVLSGDTSNSDIVSRSDISSGSQQSFAKDGVADSTESSKSAETNPTDSSTLSKPDTVEEQSDQGDRPMPTNFILSPLGKFLGVFFIQCILGSLTLIGY